MGYSYYKNILSDIKSKIEFEPKVAIVLGSGLGSFSEEIDIKYSLPYSKIKDFPTSTVEGHKGRFIFGYVGDVPVVAMEGRVHYYEGYSMEKVILPIRIMRMLGAEYIILSNAAGGINRDFSQGDLMIIRDHISTFVPSPLIGKNIDELGVRFPDMTEVYNRELIEKIKSASKAHNVDIKEGVYVQLTGPNYESPAEIKMLGLLGADAVGMSTVCEAIAARHCGFKVCGISLITNMAAGISKTPLSHSEVQETANKAQEKFKAVVKELVLSIYKE